jgi:HEAT repeat protein
MLEERARKRSDPVWERERDKEDALVAAALRTAGVDVRSVYDLVNTNEPYPEAIPVLLEYLPKVRNEIIKAGVARALTVGEARPVAAKPLIREFLTFPSETEKQQHTKWAIGNALSVVADDSVFEEVLALLTDQRHGWTRSGVVEALVGMRIHRNRAVAALMGFLDDKDLATQAVIALGNLRVPEARPRIEPFLKHPDPWVRQQTKRALAKIDKARQGG